ncbi:hypothetical protein QQF64_007270 [Cirrhinus molitorella]|uniref:Uncharacterized protein n=1 Tax=Cirrhinus molitorella TaxID=172907 RepID=A0ABR3MAV7_9TELE
MSDLSTTFMEEVNKSFQSAGGHFFNRNSVSPRSVVCEMELPDIQASLDILWGTTFMSVKWSIDSEHTDSGEKLYRCRTIFVAIGRLKWM